MPKTDMIFENFLEPVRENLRETDSGAGGYASPRCEVVPIPTPIPVCTSPTGEGYGDGGNFPGWNNWN